MSKLSRDDVLKLAHLSRLKLTEAEIEEFQHELSALLDYVEKLQDTDASSLKPINQVGELVNVMREDEVKSYGYTPSDLLKNVPSIENDQIKVKRVVA